MARKILALIAGLVVFTILTMLVQFANVSVSGVPSQQTMADPARMKEWVAAMPVAAFVVLLMSYVIGSFGSGFVMARIANWNSLVLPLVVGLFGTAAWAYMLFQLPHPTWVSVLGFLCFIPFAILGYRIGTTTPDTALVSEQ